ncbi:hypothetical protein NL676_014875 [Syzygium grande]|nr:hypothetical protein NL676_014875 [Syzygium grande]
MAMTRLHASNVTTNNESSAGGGGGGDREAGKGMMLFVSSFELEENWGAPLSFDRLTEEDNQALRGHLILLPWVVVSVYLALPAHLSVPVRAPGGTHLHRWQHVVHVHALFLELSLHLWSQSGMQSAGTPYQAAKEDMKTLLSHGNVRRGRWAPASNLSGGNRADVGGFAWWWCRLRWRRWSCWFGWTLAEAGGGTGNLAYGGDGVGRLAGTLAGAGGGTGTYTAET